MHSGHKVFIEVNNYILLIISHSQWILDQLLRPYLICLINTIANAVNMYYSTTVYCDCTTMIYQSPHVTEGNTQQQEREQKIAEIQQNEDSKRDLKDLKKSVSVVKRARVAYNKFLMEKKRDYNVHKKLHIDAIKALRQDARAAVRTSPTYKAMNSAYAKQKALAKKTGQGEEIHGQAAEEALVERLSHVLAQPAMGGHVDP